MGNWACSHWAWGIGELELREFQEINYPIPRTGPAKTTVPKSLSAQVLGIEVSQ
ncbi:MAG: hypothetical protein F6J93_10765 [Oscillatoria sp. SIO1A7]|nr:hypothetical protein [Oscillatoria sp. SIO1A7]